MTREELVGTIADEAGITKKEAGEALKSITGSIESALKKGDSVTLTGFGAFSLTYSHG